MFLTVAFITLTVDQIVALGLPGVAIIVLAKLLLSKEKVNKEKDDTMLEEINKRDERYIEMLEKSLIVIQKNTEVIGKHNEQTKGDQ